MKVEVDLTEYGVKAPKWYDPINPHVINASGGSGGSNDVELTFAEYEALSEEEKMNGSNYFITDIGNPKSLVNKTLLSSCKPTVNTTYTLSDSIFNYDYIMVNTYWTSLGNGQNGTNIIFSENLVIGNNSSYTVIPSGGRNIDFKIVTDTTISITNAYDVSGYSWEIVGYRYERVVVPNQMVNYSTVEQRIGTWIDGKPLYQKSFYFEDPLSVSSTDIDLNLQNINKVVGYTGFFDQGENAYVPLPYVTRNDGPATYTGVWFNVTQNNSVLFSYRVGNAMSQYFINIYITLQYTKTTD